MTMDEARVFVRQVMLKAEPSKQLDPEIVDHVAEVLMRLMNLNQKDATQVTQAARRLKENEKPDQFRISFETPSGRSYTLVIYDQEDAEYVHRALVEARRVSPKK
jgi:hypothetical protein